MAKHLTCTTCKNAVKQSDILICEGVNCGTRSCCKCAMVQFPPDNAWFCEKCSVPPLATGKRGKPEAPTFPMNTPDLSAKVARVAEKLGTPDGLPKAPELPGLSGNAASSNLNVNMDGSLDVCAQLNTLTQLMTNMNVSMEELKQNVATKGDLQSLRNEMEVKLSESVSPLKNDVKNIPKIVEEEVSKRVGPFSSSASTHELNNLTKIVEQQQKLVDRLDPATKSLVVIGFTDETAEDRISMIEKFAKEHLVSCGSVKVSNEYKGAYGNRSLKSLSTMEFESTQKRDAAFEKFKNGLVMKSNGTSLKVDKAKLQRQRTRNGLMYKAEELVKTHAKAAGKSVSIEWGKSKTQRAVMVGDVIAFVQEPSDVCGKFVGEFSDLKFQ